MNTKHTPAPWDRKLICTGEYSSAWRVSHTFKPAIYPRIICDVNANLGDTQGDANAKLIAAAPELLEACQKLVTWLRSIRDEDENLVIDHGFVDGFNLTAAEGIIAKATA